MLLCSKPFDERRSKRSCVKQNVRRQREEKLAAERSKQMRMEQILRREEKRQLKSERHRRELELRSARKYEDDQKFLRDVYASQAAEEAAQKAAQKAAQEQAISSVNFHCEEKFDLISRDAVFERLEAVWCADRNRIRWHSPFGFDPIGYHPMIANMVIATQDNF